MARFRYRMQNILDIKNKMEVQAKQEFSMAQSVLNEEEEKLEAFKQRKAAYEEEAKRLRMRELKVKEILENRTGILNMEELIKEQTLQVQLARTQVEKAREKLQEVIQERKTQEKLREKAFEEFMKEENRTESKEIDELVSYTYGKRIRENEGQVK